MNLRTAVIPAAGLGTRFLPATKAVPKELFPIGDRPAISIVIDEAVGAGIDHIVIVTSHNKPALEAHFAADNELADRLDTAGKHDLADTIRGRNNTWHLDIIHQDTPKGLGHAVNCARDAVGDHPFAVLLPDELVDGPHLLTRMIDVTKTTGGSSVAVCAIDPQDVHAYGVIAPAGPADTNGVIGVADLIEKPAAGTAPSNYILTGRYTLTADIFDHLDQLQPGAGGELQLTDALRAQAAHQPLHAVIADSGRYDTGTPLGYLTATIELGLRDPRYNTQLREFLRTLEL